MFVNQEKNVKVVLCSVDFQHICISSPIYNWVSMSNNVIINCNFYWIDWWDGGWKCIFYTFFAHKLCEIGEICSKTWWRKFLLIYFTNYARFMWKKCWWEHFFTSHRQKRNKFSWQTFLVLFSDICRIKSTAPIPDRCILKCMQILYDNECCSICENDIDFWEKLMDNKHTLLEKSKMEFCLGKSFEVAKLN